MIDKFIKLQFDLSVAGFAYSVGYIYLSLFYLIAFLAPPLKNILDEYEINGTKKSIIIITLISGCIYYAALYFFILNSPARAVSLIETFIWFLLFIGGGFLALFLLYEYKNKENNFS